MTYNSKIKFRNKKIVVIGGSGLIGLPTVCNLNSLGAKIIILDVKKILNYLKILFSRNSIVQKYQT